MANPTWFDETFYLKGKLAQLKAVDPDGKLNGDKAWSTVAEVKAALEAAGYEGDEGLYQHFVDFGMDENISPNEGFDAMFYLNAKAAALNVVKYEGKEWDAASVMDAFKAAGIESAWEHYQLYGSSEGIATSAAFDSEAYFVAKVKQLNDTGYDTRSNWTVDEVKAAFAEQGLTALEHYKLYGEDENMDTYGDFATAEIEDDGTFDIYTGVKTYATLEDALDAQAAGSLAENYAIAKGGDKPVTVSVAQQAGLADLLAGATPAITENFKYTYTLVDTVEAIANVSTLVMQGSVGYEIKDTLANITAAADGSVVKKAADVTIADLGGDKGLSSSSFDKHVFGSDTGFVSTAKKASTPWTSDTDDLLVATNGKTIDFTTLKGLDWTGAEHFVTSMEGAANILEGGKGDDTLVGKDGVMDVFLFNSWTLDGDSNNTYGGQLLGNDTIYNFEIGTDKLLINDPYAVAGKGMIDGSSYVTFGEKDGNATITIDGTFFHDRLGTSGAEGDDLTITLMGVTQAAAVKAGADLFAFVAAAE